MEQLLQHHIHQTEKNFDEIKNELTHFNSKLDDLAKFKAEMITSSRWVSVIVSAICGAVTMTGSALLNYFLTVKHTN